MPKVIWTPISEAARVLGVPELEIARELLIQNWPTREVEGELCMKQGFQLRRRLVEDTSSEAEPPPTSEMPSTRPSLVLVPR